MSCKWFILLRDKGKGFYSVYFLGFKKMGEVGPIIDCLTFCMLTIKQLVELVQPGDWFTNINYSRPTFPSKRPRNTGFCIFPFKGIMHKLPIGNSDPSHTHTHTHFYLLGQVQGVI